MYKKEDFVFLKEEIQKTKSEDFSNITELYNEIYIVKNYKNFIWNHTFKQNSSFDLRCPCFYVTRYNSHLFSSNRFKHYLDEVLFSQKLEQEFSQEDCLKFLLKHTYFLENKGFKYASQYYFEKEFNDLNIDEKITLILMSENPSLYNPRRRPELVKEKVELYKKRLN